MVQAPAEIRVTVAPNTVQTGKVVEAKLTARPDDAVAVIVNGAAPNVWLGNAPKAIVWAADPFCVTAICWPRTVIFATRDVVALAVNEKLMTPLAMVPMGSQLWSLVGAKTPVRGVVEGSTGSSESDPAEAGSVKLAGPTKA